MNAIYLIHKSDPKDCPPLLNVAVGLRRAGYAVTVMAASCVRATADWLAERQVTVQVLGGYCDRDRTAFPIRWWNMIAFSVKVRPVLMQIKRQGGAIIIGSLETAVALLPHLPSIRYGLLMHELYDRQTRWRLFRATILRRAAFVVVPNGIRAALLRYWCRLTISPFVLYNRPLEIEASA